MSKNNVVARVPALPLFPFALAALFLFLAAGDAAAQRNGVFPKNAVSAPAEPTYRFYFPLVTNSTPIPLGPPLPPPIPLSATPPIDWDAVRADLQANGLDLAFAKIGFHTGFAGNTTGLWDYLDALDAAGVPFFLKSVDDAGHLYHAQQLAQASGVPHTLVWRRSGLGYDLPNYDAPPAVAAQSHWDLHKAAWPPELDPSLVWIETVNEVDKNRSEWLAEFALETAQLAIADGYRWAAFGWSSGEPEVSHWQGPQMLAFLQFAAAHPHDVAIALHEYSYIEANIADGYPYKIGRFQFLFDVCDDQAIGRPTVLITEWGWEYQNVPDVAPAMADVAWAAWMYAYYPQVKGAAIWYLGDNFGTIDDQVQQLIAPMQDYAQSNYFAIAQGVGQIDMELFRP